MPNLFIESRNYPRKQRLRLLFFKRATRQILQKMYSEELLVPNLIEIKVIEILITYLFDGWSPIDLLQDLAKIFLKNTSLYAFPFIYPHFIIL